MDSQQIAELVSVLLGGALGGFLAQLGVPYFKRLPPWARALLGLVGTIAQKAKSEKAEAPKEASPSYHKYRLVMANTGEVLKEETGGLEVMRKMRDMHETMSRSGIPVRLEKI